MSSIDIITIVIIGLCLFFILLSTTVNPLIYVGQRILDASRVNVTPFIRVMERDGDRLFVIEPEQIILYNTTGVLYYYFEGGTSRRLCPNNEFAIVRFTTSDINLLNETGTYNVSCTNTSSLNLYEHFANDSATWDISIFTDPHSIIDIINNLITEGYCLIH
ncbi:pif-4 [Psilogramma increta granulovirus]|uniref:Pif-4 n=1 Tax=Psilogramma increta granulovirus TaxID=2953508 RepID=A0A977XVK2_9BBAC|nr:pif-4 [Psilogramma increta granulovirus]